jgi:hypothetical protein
VISIVSGAAERRALFAIKLPQLPTATSLSRATFLIHLEANADATLSRRRLGLHSLLRAFVEARASWTNYDKQGNARWSQPGGDFGSEMASAVVPRGVSSGDIGFDVTSTVQEALDSRLGSLSWIALETTAAPAAPANLSFVSAQGSGVTTPVLVLQYCDSM